jgi:ribose transport system permease protein
MTPKHQRRLPEETGIFLVLMLVLVVMGMLSAPFRTVSNGLTLLLNGSVIAFLALGQTFVLLTGGIDLSTGANVAMTGVLVALLMQMGISWPLAALLTLAAGVLLGVINGALIHFVRVPAFIATFSTMGVASSIPLIIAGANSIAVADPGFAVVGQGLLFGVPIPVVLLLVVAVIAGLMLVWTRLGVHIYAVGGNSDAARLAGIGVGRTVIVVYALSGLCAAFGGLISTSRLMVGFPSTGLGNELFFSIAAAVVGGVSLFGGSGTILGAMIGAVLVASVSDGMNVMNVSSYWQPLVIGVIILAGVTLDTYRRRLAGQGVGSLFSRLWANASATKVGEPRRAQAAERVREPLTSSHTEQ